ncbi:MAG: C40 family peptidase [Flavobacterium sp.]|nr:C40 family peptidase [Flavobacterium sp.]
MQKNKKKVLKNLSYLFLIIALVTSCKTKSVIITSKKEAQKNNIYQTPIQKTTAIGKKNIATKKVDIDSQKNETFSNIAIDKSEHDYAKNPDYDKYFAEGLIQFAQDNLGSHYQTGGITKAGFDCSGLMYATFKNFDIILPRTSNEMSRFGLKLNLMDARKGDLIFFKTNGRKVINHVGMIVEILDDEIKFIHSSTTNGVMISSTKEGYYRKNLAQVNRILR